MLTIDVDAHGRGPCICICGAYRRVWEYLVGLGQGRVAERGLQPAEHLVVRGGFRLGTWSVRVRVSLSKCSAVRVRVRVRLGIGLG